MLAAVVTLALVLVACADGPTDGSTERSGRSGAPHGSDAGAGDGDAATPPAPGPIARDSGTTPRRDGGSVAPVDSGPGGTGGSLTPEEQDLLDAINAERATDGLAPVRVDERLMCAARRHALDVGASGACGHVGSDGSWPWDRAMACGFPQTTWTVNEIAAGPGFRDGEDAVWGWSHSSGHYAALMHPRAQYVGVAVHMTCFIALFDCCVAGSE